MPIEIDKEFTAFFDDPQNAFTAWQSFVFSTLGWSIIAVLAVALYPASGDIIKLLMRG